MPFSPAAWLRCATTQLPGILAHAATRYMCIKPLSEYVVSTHTHKHTQTRAPISLSSCQNNVGFLPSADCAMPGKKVFPNCVLSTFFFSSSSVLSFFSLVSEMTLHFFRGSGITVLHQRQASCQTLLLRLLRSSCYQHTHTHVGLIQVSVSGNSVYMLLANHRRQTGTKKARSAIAMIL